MKERINRFQVHERMVPYVSYFMDEEDWRLVDLAGQNGEIPQEQCPEEVLENAYKRGILNKKKEEGRVRYYLGTFHKRIDCCVRGERAYFEELPAEVRNAVVEYEQDIGLWVIPYREEGVNKKIVNPVPLEKALDIVEKTACRYYVQECDCKIYRHEKRHMKETCIHFFDEENLLNSNFDRGYGRELIKEEVKQLLVEIDRDGLIHNFEGDAFCNCCSCCCWAVRGMKTYEEKGYDVFGEYVNAEYIIMLDKSKCAGCGACGSICPMNALKLTEGGMSVLADKCIGCGVCRTRCRYGALSIQRRSGEAK